MSKESFLCIKFFHLTHILPFLTMIIMILSLYTTINFLNEKSLKKSSKKSSKKIL
uniref:ATP synthase subunit 8 n=1 Tax=Ayyaria chaetophora TaxID=1291247 RepID=UPI0030E57B5C